MKVKKIPMRRCIGCMESKPKKELIRIVCNQEKTVSVDGTGKAPGRGAYLCPSTACFTMARKKKAISRNLEVPLTEEQLDAIFEELKAYEK